MSAHQLKYVRHSTVGFVVWPAKYPGLTHKEVARAVRTGEDVTPGVVLSAGFVHWDFDGRPFCNGRSESLNLDSRDDDTAALHAEWGTPAALATPALNPDALAAAQAFGAGLSDEALEQGDAK